MPLRDHFHAPLIKRHSWEGFHAQWPAMLVIRLGAHLPDGYTAEPRAHIGTSYEIDVGAFELEGTGGSEEHDGGVATLPYTAPKPTLTLDADIGEQYEYEVLIFDHNREERQLVAAVEFVSPTNKESSSAPPPSFKPVRTPRITNGACVIFSIPPASTIVASPSSNRCSACVIASIPEPQRRFTVTAGVSIFSPAFNPTCLAP